MQECQVNFIECLLSSLIINLDSFSHGHTKIPFELTSTERPTHTSLHRQNAPPIRAYIDRTSPPYRIITLKMRSHFLKVWNFFYFKTLYNLWIDSLYIYKIFFYFKIEIINQEICFKKITFILCQKQEKRETKNGWAKERKGGKVKWQVTKGVSI